MKYFLLLVIFSSSIFAKDLVYYLNYYGDTISKSLIKNKHAKNMYDSESIKSVLDYNELSWSDARYLPVGFKFLVHKNDLKQVVKNQEDVWSYRVEVGLFHHNISREDTEVFSNLSQYALLNIGYRDFFLNLRLDNTIYSKDSDQNISKNSTEYMYDIALGKELSYVGVDFGIGAIYKNVLSYSIDSSNEVGVDDFGSLGLNLFVTKNFIVSNSYSISPLLNLSRQVVNSNIKNLTSAELALISKIKALGNKFDLALRYEHSFFEIDLNSLSARKASLGLGYSF